MSSYKDPLETIQTERYIDKEMEDILLEDDNVVRYCFSNNILKIWVADTTCTALLINHIKELGYESKDFNIKQYKF